jgi:hypothetical protein
MTGRPRSWTDDDLIRAVEESTTISDVLRHLGLGVGGGPLAAVRRRMLELGLDRPDLLRGARSAAWAADPDDLVAQASAGTPWTEDELRWAVTTSTSMREVMAQLGYPASGSRWTAAKADILRLGLDTSHFGRTARREAHRLAASSPVRPRSWTDDDLRRAVRGATSIAGVIRALGLKVGGSVYVTIRERINGLNLDTSHFKGQAWNKGLSVTTWPGRPLAEILVENSDYRTTSSLRARLIKEGLLEPRCAVCGLTEWNGVPAPLQLDHINGIRTDNRLENLRLLCPNCHAQTDTWCGKNRGRGAGIILPKPLASVVETVYTQASSPCAARLEGSSPSRGTRPTIQLSFGDLGDLD